MSIQRRKYSAATSAVITFPGRPLGHLSTLAILPNPISAGPWLFRTAEHLLQASKFPAHPQYQEFISSINSGSHAIKESGWGPPYCRDAWNERRVPVARWAIRAALEANPEPIKRDLAETSNTPVVLHSSDTFWGATLDISTNTLEGTNALGRLWQEVRTQLHSHDTLLSAAHWRHQLGPHHLGRMAAPPNPDAPLLSDLPNPCNKTRPTPPVYKAASAPVSY